MDRFARAYIEQQRHNSFLSCLEVIPDSLQLALEEQKYSHEDIVMLKFADNLKAMFFCGVEHSADNVDCVYVFHPNSQRYQIHILHKDIFKINIAITSVKVLKIPKQTVDLNILQYYLESRLDIKF
jgi:hypothetical protein